MSLQKAIDNAMREFTNSLVEAIRTMPLIELLEARGEAAAPRAPKAAKVKAPKKAKKEKPAKKEKASAKGKKHNYPKCTVPGCKRTRWSQGGGMCGMHFKAEKAKVAAANSEKKPLKKVKPAKAKAPKKVKVAKVPKVKAVPKPKKEKSLKKLLKKVASEKPMPVIKEKRAPMGADIHKPPMEASAASKE